MNTSDERLVALFAAAKCAVAANAIDMGVASAITEAEVRAALRGLPEEPIHGDWEGFLDAAAKATDILYLADNAGEIVFEIADLTSPSDADRLPNGHTIVAEDGRVREFDRFGNQVWEYPVSWAVEVNRY